MKKQKTQKADKPQIKPALSSIEEDTYEALIGFQQRVMTLLRQSLLEGVNLKLLTERIKLVMKNMSAEMKCSQDGILAGRLEVAYEEIQRFVEELSAKDEK